MALTVFLAAPSPDHLRSRVHPLVSFASSSESFLSRTCLPTAIDGLPPRGSVPSSRQQHEKSTCRWAFHVPPTGRPQCFSHCRRFMPSRTWWTCFIPHAMSKVHLTRAFLGTQPYWLIASQCSLDLLITDPFVVELPRLHQRLKPGLQSLHPSVNPLTLTEVLRLSLPRSPLKFSNPSGFR
jgi:hypothetical protein